MCTILLSGYMQLQNTNYVRLLYIDFRSVVNRPFFAFDDMHTTRHSRSIHNNHSDSIHVEQLVLDAHGLSFTIHFD